jgi:hypothetical protein
VSLALRQFGHIVSGVYTPVLAKCSQNFRFEDGLAGDYSRRGRPASVNRIGTATWTYNALCVDVAVGFRVDRQQTGSCPETGCWEITPDKWALNQGFVGSDLHLADFPGCSALTGYKRCRCQRWLYRRIHRLKRSRAALWLVLRRVLRHSSLVHFRLPVLRLAERWRG